MEETAGPSRYSAFISYSHHDLRRGIWLQRRIETYRLPRPLRGVGAVTAHGRLRPVFRDTDELTAAADLTTAVREGLASSSYLIVICTPHAVASRWVGREIALFRSANPPERVLAALLEGDSASAFPPQLKTASPGIDLQPLAADFRARGGRRLALLKLVAVLAGVRLDDLVRRDAQRRRRRWSLAIAALIAVTAAVGTAAVVAMRARAEAQDEQRRGIATIERLVGERARVAKAGNLDLLKTYDRAALDFFRGRDVAALPAAAQLLSVKLLHGICEDDETGGDFAGLKDAASTAWRTTDRLLAAGRDDPARILAHAHSEHWLGLAAWRLGDLQEAERRFVGYARLAERLLAIGPTRADWLIEAGDADSNLATYLLRTAADVPRAGRLFRRAQDRFEAAARGPYDRDVQDELADGYGWLADVARLEGQPAVALAYRMRQRAALTEIGRRDPTDGGIEPALIKNRLGIARALAGRREWAHAIATLEQGRDEAAQRLRRDPTNTDMARQIRAFDLFEVRTWLDMPRAARPPVDRIAAVLGDCARERRRAHNDEVAAFCGILAGRLRRGGDGVAAGTSAPVPKALTERWRLDLAAEAMRP